MMGRAHALSGMALWLAGAPLLSHTTGVFQLDTATWLAGAVITGGAALAPDLDHPGASSASNSLKPVTTVLSNFVAIIGFGHRKATHSIIGVLAFAALMLIATGPLAPWGVLISAFLLTAFACKAIGFNVFRYLPIRGSQPVATVLTAAAVTWITYAVSAGNYDWFLWAAAVGYAAHLLGDAITVMGIPLAFPFGGDIRLATMRAGGFTELVILTPLFLLLIVWSGFQGVSSGHVFNHPVENGNRQSGSITAFPWAGDEPQQAGKPEPSPKPKPKPSQPKGKNSS